MSNQEILTILKTDLHISVDETTEVGKALISELQFMINRSIDEIRIMGITIDFTNDADCMLVEEYSAWMYRRRSSETATAMPRYLQYSLNNRLFHEKAGDM